MIESDEFTSGIAFDIWKKLNEPHVSILNVQYPTDTFAYEVSARLPRPKIKVTYLKFPRE